MSGRRQELHDTAANWTSADSVLRIGEIGFEEDTGLFKFGDGSTAWTSLPYAGGGGAAALDDLTDVNAPAPSDGDVLSWVDMAGEWQAVAPGAASHPNLATHDALGLATDAELATHAALTTHHAAVTLASDADVLLGLSTQQLTLDSQSANLVFAGPDSGGAADPTFRALVDADIPAAIARDAEVAAAYQPLDSDLTAFAGLAIAADKLPYGTGSHTLGLADFTSAGRALVDDADAAAQRTTLGVGTGDSPEFAAVNVGAASDTTVTRTGAGDLAVEGNAIYRAGGTDVPVADGGTGASTGTAGLANLGVANSGGGDVDVASVTDITIASITTAIAAGNVFLLEIWGTIFNNSGASRIYTFTLDVDGFLVSIATLAGLTNSATARSPFNYSGHVEVRATNLVYGDAILSYRNSIAAATATAETARLWVWNTGTSDRTGAGKVVAIKVKSANATATQNLLYFARITKV